MKKMIVLFSVVASVLMLAACASKGTADQSASSANMNAPVAHHDYKGESSVK